MKSSISVLIAALAFSSVLCFTIILVVLVQPTDMLLTLFNPSVRAARSDKLITLERVEKQVGVEEGKARVYAEVLKQALTDDDVISDHVRRTYITNFAYLSAAILVAISLYYYYRRSYYMALVLRPDDQGQFPVLLRDFVTKAGEKAFAVINSNRGIADVSGHVARKTGELESFFNPGVKEELYTDVVKEQSRAAAAAHFQNSKMSAGTARFLLGHKPGKEVAPRLLTTKPDIPTPVGKQIAPTTLLAEIKKADPVKGLIPLGQATQENGGAICFWNANDAKQLGIFGSNGCGKELADSEPILTPQGWKLNGEMRVGDQVIGVDGKPCGVVGVFPQGVKQIYKITFSDGTFSRCGGEHLWEISNVFTKRIEVVDINELLQRPLRYPGGTNYIYRIPLLEDSVQFEYQELPLNPYLLGALLGDGGMSRKDMLTFTSVDEESVARVQGNLPVSDSLVHSVSMKRISYRSCNYRILGKSTRSALKQLGLEGKRSEFKFIPEVYLKASPEARLALLRGLMDADGTVSTNQGPYLTTVSEGLCDGVQEIVHSLGGTTRVNRIQSRFAGYLAQIRITIKLPAGLNPFALSRKALAYVSKRDPVRSITSIEEDGFESATCISVDGPRGLYLTRSCIVTHNTKSAAFSAVLTMIYWGYKVCVLDNKHGADWRSLGDRGLIQYHDSDPETLGSLIESEIMPEVMRRAKLISEYGCGDVDNLPDNVRPLPFALVIEELGSTRMTAEGLNILNSIDGPLDLLMRESRYTGLRIIVIDQRPVDWPKTVRANMKATLTFKQAMLQGSAVGYYHAGNLANVGEFAMEGVRYWSWNAYEILDQLVKGLGLNARRSEPKALPNDSKRRREVTAKFTPLTAELATDEPISTGVEVNTPVESVLEAVGGYQTPQDYFKSVPDCTFKEFRQATGLNAKEAKPIFDRLVKGFGNV